MALKAVTNAQVMRRALTYARDFEALIVHHTEDPDLVGDGVMNEGEFAARLGLLGIPKAAETIMLERDLRLVALTGGRYHAASVTCAESLDVLRRAKDAGLDVTASASINHVTLNENDIGPYRTFLKLSPPLRAEDDRKLLVEALASGAGRRRDVGPQSAGRRDQAAAVCRGCARRDRHRDDADRRPTAGAQRRTRSDDIAARAFDVGLPNCSACPAARSRAARPPTSSWSMPMCLGYSIPRN